MSFFTDIGPLTWITPGATHYWHYRFPDTVDHGLLIAGPNLDRNGSFGETVLWAEEQGKQSELNPNRGFNYFVRIRAEGKDILLYNLQIGGFP